MLKKIQRLFCFQFKVAAVTALLVFSAIQPSYASLTLQLTTGRQSKLPIAITDFSGEKNLSLESQPSKVIEMDLLNSGEFKVSSGKSLPAQPHSVRMVQLAQWRDHDVRDLVVGSVSQTNDGRYRVAISLINVYGAMTKSGGVAPSGVLFSKSYTVDKKDLRSLSHKLSHKIYEKLTGKPGVFSTNIAYISVDPSRRVKNPTYNLMVADYDGYNPHKLVSSNEPIMSPTWSPDRQYLAFVSFKAKRPALYKVNIHTGKLTQLTSVGSVNGAPAWSPDGSKIAFASAKTGVPKIYLLDLVSQKTTQLTQGISIDTEPSFAPDGKSLIFTSNRSGTPQVNQYNFANKTTERLTYNSDYSAKASICDKYMVMLEGSNHEYNIAVQNLETDEVTQLTHDGRDESPSWAPGCNLIIYATHLQNRPALAIVSRDGDVNINFPEQNMDALEPVWK